MPNKYFEYVTSLRISTNRMVREDLRNEESEMEKLEDILYSTVKNTTEGALNQMAEKTGGDSTLGIPYWETKAKEFKSMADSLIKGLALRLRKAAFAYGGLALVAMVVGGIELDGVLCRPSSAYAASKGTSGTWTPDSADALGTKKLTEPLDQARSLTQERKYNQAEDIYRSILKTDPSNTEVKRLLASALFRNEKIDECVEVLNNISEEKQAITQEINAPSHAYGR
jgi:hypothetical protein